MKSRIERVLYGKLLASGLSRNEIALLLQSVAKGSETASRVLDTAAEAFITPALENPVLSYTGPNGDWSGDTVAVATVTLGKDYGWRAGELFDPKGTIPGTLATALIGRPSRALIEHPDINPDAVLSIPVTKYGVAAVPMEWVEIKAPRFPIGRLRHWRNLLKQRRSEKITSTKISVPLVLSTMFLTLAMISQVFSAMHEAATIITMISAVITSLSWLGVMLLAVNVLTGRLLSDMLTRERTIYEMAAWANHQTNMMAKRTERGFTDEGMPI